MPTPVSQRVGRSGEREQVPDEDIHDGDHDEGSEPVPAPRGWQPATRGALEVAYELESPAKGTDPNEYAHDERQRVGRPCSGHVPADQRLRQMRPAAEGT